MPSGRLSTTRLEGNVVKQVPECSLNVWEYLKNQRTTRQNGLVVYPVCVFHFPHTTKVSLVIIYFIYSYTFITDGYVYGYNIIYECLATFKLFPIFQY